jgi:peptidoglycan hydrolase-like protein with peptidoglycan-binding domain
MKMDASRATLALTGLVWITLMSISPARGGFFDELVDKAKQTTQETYEKALDATLGAEDGSGTAAQSSAPPAQYKTASKPAQPVYDRKLVQQIQIQINGIGISVGTADGIYGKGTKSGIEQFQRQQSFKIDGVPTKGLLARLEATNTQALDQ